MHPAELAAAACLVIMLVGILVMLVLCVASSSD
jgi:hypothetical protein